jgi:hypothetical protein
MNTSTLQNPRHPPALAELLAASEGRFPKDDELAALVKAIPAAKERVEAVRAIARVTPPVVNVVVHRILEVYPLAQTHDYSPEKCQRDITLVINYAALTLLAEDPGWFRDKLLVWMKTIIQAARFPDRTAGVQRVFADPASTAIIDNLKPWQRCIWETYALLNKEFSASLPAPAYRAFAPCFEQALNTLAND